MTPPRLAVLLLRASCPASDWPWVIAELEEEYVGHVLPRNGRKAARRWFWSQAVRSLGALAMKGVRGGDWECALLFILLASAGPAVLVEAWWGYLLSLVPYKAELMRGSDFITVSLALHACMGLFAGALCSPRGLLVGIPAAWVFTLLGQTAARSLTVPWFCAAAVLVLTASMIAGAYARRIFENPEDGRFA
jgi:hypothetical protein